MLSTVQISSIATVLGIKAEDLQAKISSEKEEELKLPKMEIFTEADFATRLRNEKSSSYEEGKVAQEEMLVKGAKKDLGYEIEAKDFKGFIAHHNAQLKTTYSKDSSARVIELEADIEKLNKTHVDALGAKDMELSNLRTESSKQGVKNQLLGFMPKETTIGSEDIITLFNAGHEVVFEEGKQLIKKGGETLKDANTAEPLGLKDVFDTFVDERKFVSGAEGRGAGNEFGKGTKVKSMDDFNAKWTASGKPSIGREYDEAYAKAKSEIKD